MFTPSRPRAPGSFHAVYTSDGKAVFETHDPLPRGPIGRGLPLEKPGAFAFSKAGRVSVTRFDGRVLAERVLLDSAKFEDGDIRSRPGNGGKTIFALANRFLFPRVQIRVQRFTPSTTSSRNSRRVPKTYYLATGIQASPDGKFVAIHTELEDGTSPVIIADNAGREFAFRIGPGDQIFGRSKISLTSPAPASGGLLSCRLASRSCHRRFPIPSSLDRFFDFR